MASMYGEILPSGRSKDLDNLRPDDFSKKGISGLYRAIVEDVQDPDLKGRVRIRIPSIHGMKDQRGGYISTERLPWATPAYMVAGNDFGTYLIPSKGSVVFVMFEDGDMQYPVYFGGVS